MGWVQHSVCLFGRLTILKSTQNVVHKTWMNFKSFLKSHLGILFHNAYEFLGEKDCTLFLSQRRYRSIHTYVPIHTISGSDSVAGVSLPPLVDTQQTYRYETNGYRIEVE